LSKIQSNTEGLIPYVPGVSGNPSGRPKGARNRSTIYREHMEKLGKNGMVVDDMVLAAIKKAVDGDINALKELMDGGYGKIPDKVLTAETTEEALERDVTTEVLKHVPTEELEKIIDGTANIRNDI